MLHMIQKSSRCINMAFVQLITKYLQMESLTSKMRALAIQSIKSRREQIFERTRNLIEMKDTEEEQEESVCSQLIGEREADFYHGQKQEKMQEECRPSRKPQKKRKSKGPDYKSKGPDYKTKRYWRRLMQVNDWMVSVPQNLSQFFVAVRGEGSKCLLIMKYDSVQICDKSGSTIAQLPCPHKAYNGTILEVYFNQMAKTIIVSDLIVWKSNPMTGSQFDFRHAWTISNLNIKLLAESTHFQIFFTQYFPCTVDNLRYVYETATPYKKEGLVFVHKDSSYEHGHNPNVLLWKDPAISMYFEQEMADNKMGSRGVGYINKQGEVRSLENVTLFVLDREKIGPEPRFVKFTYTAIEIEPSAEQKVEVKLQDLILCQTCKYHNGPVDSLGKLYHKSTLKYGFIKFQQILSSAATKMMAE